MKKVEFGPYNWAGDPDDPDARNYPTWLIQSFFGDLGFQGGPKDDSKYIQYLFRWWLQGYPQDVVQSVAQSFIMNAVRIIDWYWILNELEYKPNQPGEIDELTYLTYNTLLTTDWQVALNNNIRVDKDVKPFVDAVHSVMGGRDEAALQQWVESVLLTWADEGRARKADTPSSRLAKKIVEIYLGAVQWDHVDSSLRGE